MVSAKRRKDRRLLGKARQRAQEASTSRAPSLEGRVRKAKVFSFLSRELNERLAVFQEEVQQRLVNNPRRRALPDKNFTDLVENILGESLLELRDQYSSFLHKGEAILHELQRVIFADPLREGRFGYERGTEVLPQYIVRARCPAREGSFFEVVHYLTERQAREWLDVERYSRNPAYCKECMEVHPTLVSLTRYVTKEWEELSSLKEKVEEAFPLMLPRAGIGVAADRMREVLRGLGVSALEQWRDYQRRHSVLEVLTRVKGVESLANQLTDLFLGIPRPGRRRGKLQEIYDIYGIKVCVSGRKGVRAVQSLLRRSKQKISGYEILIDDREEMDYWDKPKMRRGNIVFQGLKFRLVLLSEEGVCVPVDMHVQTPDMLNRDRLDHKTYVEEKEKVREEFGEQTNTAVNVFRDQLARLFGAYARMQGLTDGGLR